MALTRTQAAEKLGIGVRRLRDLEKEGRITPKGEKGERRKYTLAQIERFLEDNPREARPKRLAPPQRSRKKRVTGDGETAAAIFELLRLDTKKIEIVISLRVHPDLVDEMALKYQRMREGEGEAARAPCAKCGSNAARFCGGCIAA